MFEAAMAFIVRTTDCRSPALSILRRRLAVVSLKTAPWVPFAGYRLELRFGLRFGNRLGFALQRRPVFGFRFRRDFGLRLGLRLGLKADERVAHDADNFCPVFVAQFSGGIESLVNSAGMFAAASCTACSRPSSGRSAPCRRVPRSTPAGRQFVRARTPERIPTVSGRREFAVHAR